MLFTGRGRELRVLQGLLDEVVAGGRTGQALVIKGRRRIGKTRLVQEFCARSGRPYVFFQAVRGQPAPLARKALLESVAEGEGMREYGAALTHTTAPADWASTLTAVAQALPAEPVILVVDELPWLVEADAGFGEALRIAWDTQLSAKPVVLLMIGSDLAMMGRLTARDHPFHGRAGQYTLGPLSPADVRDATGLGGADALDAFLVTGGFPEVVTDWRTGEPVTGYLTRQVADPSSTLLTTGERSLAAEFPARLQAGRVLRAIGAGERTFSQIALSTGGADGRPLAHGSLAPILAELTDRKRIVAAELPLSTEPAPKLKRYRIADTYLAFWLAHLENAVTQAERGLGELSAARIQRSWPSWRGQAVESVIREALARGLAGDAFPTASEFGGWWRNRQNNPEVNLVGADADPVAGNIAFVGAVKWREETPFGARELAELALAARHVPGAWDAPLVAVGRRPPTDGAREGLAAFWGPDDVLAVWSS